MDVGTLTALVTLCAPLVHPITAQAIVSTESAYNSNAIGVVAGYLERQPRQRDEAIATANALRAAGWNFSVGLAQINVHNLHRLGMSMADGFDACKSLKAMQRVLGECYEQAGSYDGSQSSLRRALSCYYSGNFRTGFRHGYVSRVIGNAQRAARAPP
jgi:type IV secretion system protein VirB1